MEAGPRIITGSELSTVTSTKTESYGIVGNTADGRRYRYVQYGGTVAAGNLVIAPTLTANHQNIAVQTAALAGSTSVTVTLGAAAATADQYAEGLLVVNVTGSAIPSIRKIKGNSAGASGAVITVFLDTREPLLYNLTTSNTVSLIPQRFSSVTASATAGFPVGIAVASATAGQYGWVQTFGESTVVNDAAGALSALGKIKQSLTVAGAIVASTAATDIQIGNMIGAASTSAAGVAFINLD